MLKLRPATIWLSAVAALPVATYAQQQPPSPGPAPSQSASGGSTTTTTTTSRPASPPSPDLNTDTNSQPDITGSSGHPDTDVRLKGTGGLASAMANFSVRTGLEIRPNSMGQVVVQSVRPDTPSARAGVEAGDIITNLSGTEITTIDSLQTLLTKRPSQGAYFLSFRRGEHNFRVPLGRQLSLMGMTLFPDPADRPVVKAVESASPAERAGFKVGDVITGVDRQDTATMAKLLDFAIPFVRNLSQGQGIPFRVVRNGKPLHFSVTRPADGDLPLLTPEQERHLRRVANGDEDRPRRDQQRPRSRKTTRTTQTTAGNQMNSANNQVAQPNQNGAVGGFGGVGVGLDGGGIGGAGLGTSGVGTTGMNGSSTGANAAVAVLRGTASNSGQQMANSGQQAGTSPTGNGGNSGRGLGVVGFVQIQSNIGLNGQGNTPSNINPSAPGANPITGNTTTNTGVNPVTGNGATNTVGAGNSSQPQGQPGSTSTNGASGFGGTSSFGASSLNNGPDGTSGLNTGLPGISVSTDGTTPGTNGTNNGTNNNQTNNGTTNNNNQTNNGNSQSFVSAQISRVPPGTYTLSVNQFGDCGDSAGAAPGPSVFTLGTITVNGGGQGSLSQNINFAPQAFIGRTVSLVAAQTGGIGPVPGQSQTAQPTGQSNSGVVGCGKFRMSGQGQGQNQGNGFIGNQNGGIGLGVGNNGVGRLAPGMTGANGTGTAGNGTATGTGTATGAGGTATGNGGAGTGTGNPTAPGSITPPGGLPRPLFP